MQIINIKELIGMKIITLNYIAFKITVGIILKKANHSLCLIRQHRYMLYLSTNRLLPERLQ